MSTGNRLRLRIEGSPHISLVPFRKIASAMDEIMGSQRHTKPTWLTNAKKHKQPKPRAHERGIDRRYAARSIIRQERIVVHAVMWFARLAGGWAGHVTERKRATKAWKESKKETV